MYCKLVRYQSSLERDSALRGPKKQAWQRDHLVMSKCDFQTYFLRAVACDAERCTATAYWVFRR